MLLLMTAATRAFPQSDTPSPADSPPTGAPPKSSGEATPDTAPRSGADAWSAALEQARAERRYLAAFVYRKDCADCDRIERETLIAREVRPWIDLIAVPVRFHDDDAAGREFAGRHQVHEFPSLLIFANDGNELGRITGFINPSDFRNRVNAVLQEADIGRSDPWAGTDVVLAAADRAGNYMLQGRYEEAQDWYVWCLRHRAARAPNFLRLHLPAIIDGFAGLVDRFEPAKEALRNEIRRAEKDSLDPARMEAFPFNVIKLGYIALGEESRIVEHYDRLAGISSAAPKRDAFARFIYEPLLNARRYKDIEWSVADDQDMIVFMDEARNLQRPPGYVHKVLGARYEVLMGLERFSAASEMATTWLRYDKSWQTYLALAEGGLRSGAIHDDIPENARIAQSMCAGTDPRPVICLARYLKRVNPEDREAIRVLETALKTVPTGKGRQAITDCLNELKAPPPDTRPGGKE